MDDSGLQQIATAAADDRLLRQLAANARRPLWLALLMSAFWALPLIIISQMLIHWLPNWLHEHRLAFCYYNGRMWLPEAREPILSILRGPAALLLIIAVCIFVIPLAAASMTAAVHRAVSTRPAALSLTGKQRGLLQNLLRPQPEWPGWLAAASWAGLNIVFAALILKANANCRLELCRHVSPNWVPTAGPSFQALIAAWFGASALALPLLMWRAYCWRRRLQHLIRNRAPHLAAAVLTSPASLPGASPVP